MPKDVFTVRVGKPGCGLCGRRNMGIVGSCKRCYRRVCRFCFRADSRLCDDCYLRLNRGW
jgi:hypothetical protein